MKLQLRNIEKSFEQQKVLSGINLELQEGNIYCLIGENGAGKSTLFHIINGIIPSTTGEVLYDGEVYKKFPKALKARIGFMGETSTLIEELNLYQYLNLVGKFFRIEHNALEQKITELVSFFFADIEKLRTKKIGDFSTGMRKKLELCASCIHSPELLILDEPFSGLDPRASELLMEFLRLYSAKKRTVIFSSHNLSYIERLDPVLLLLHKHQIQFEGNTTEFLKKGENIENLQDGVLQSLGFVKKKEELKWI